MIYNKTKWTPLVLSLFVLPFVFSCSSDDEEQPSEPKRYISVVVSENPLQSEVAEGRTRADAPITTASLNNFFMRYQNDAPYNFTKTALGWNNKEYAWPIEGDEAIDFYAYNYKKDDEKEFVFNEGNPYVAFEMEENPDELLDFLVAKHEGIKYSDAQGIVSLNFDHACAAVMFRICKTKTIAEKGNTINVSSVVLQNVKKTGNYFFKSNSWVEPAEVSKTNYTLTTSSINLDTDYTTLRAPKEWLYIIPQDKTGIKLSIDYTVNGVGGTKNRTIDLDGTWEAGNQYTINIKVGSSFLPQQQS